MTSSSRLDNGAEVHGLSPWLIPPAAGWRRKTRSSTNRIITTLFIAIGLLFVVSAVVALWLAGSAYGTGVRLAVQGSLLAAACALIAGTFTVVRRDLLMPLTHLRNWALRMRGGNLSARIPVPSGGEFVELAQDINKLGDAVHGLSRDMESIVRKEMNRAEQKNRSLQILYDVAASMNVSSDLEDLLTRFLHSLKNVVNARAAAVRLLTPEGEMEMLMSVGLSPEIAKREHLLPSSRCLCGRAALLGSVQCKSSMRECSELVGSEFFEDANVGMIAVPLQYRGRTLGIYNLFVDEEDLAHHEDMLDLFTSVGRHLGMAIEKARMDEEAQQMTVMEERTRLAHELHDSLAQSLASLRFQVRVLDETLHGNQEAAVWQELEQIENSLDEANKELRTLIEHFRAPSSALELVPAIEQIVERFRNQTSIAIFLHKSDLTAKIPESTKIEVLRIVQEALCNVRKHSKAHTVRVMMRTNSGGECSVLIEDDGIGIGERPAKPVAGDHIGLSIMEERARRLGGHLRIESDPGEGTRVVLSFRLPNTAPVIELEPLRRMNS